MRACDNPFRAGRVESLRYRLLDGSWDGLWARLESLRFRAAIVGPHGSGKTTLLEALAARLEPCRLIRLWDGKTEPDAGELDGLRDGETVFVDGAEVLPLRAWRRIASACPRLVVTAHRPGLLPTLLETRTTPSLLLELIRELDPGAAEDVDALHHRHAGDARAALRELYDVRRR